jgi:flagellum-specific ATP synthase
MLEDQVGHSEQEQVKATELRRLAEPPALEDLLLSAAEEPVLKSAIAVHDAVAPPGAADAIQGGQAARAAAPPAPRPPLPAEELAKRLADVSRFAQYGRVTRVVGLVIEAAGIDVGLGELCRVTSLTDDRSILAEVVGFHERGVLLMPLGELDGLHPGSSVRALGRSFGVDVGPGLLGRILNGLGHPIDGKGKLDVEERVPLAAEPPNPLDRQIIDEKLQTGVRALDGMLTFGRGQRVGIFAGSGVGKSTLLGMIARQASADVNVIALLGERGREVRDFLENSLGREGLAKSVVVVATGDQAALVRARGALVATAIAEYFRDQGKQVLLMLDSITRVAMAWREIGLAVGEPPTTKGYPPSVFASLPRLLERAGNGTIGGISGIYTVLVDGDDFNEPVADAARSILDGHVVLTRKLASAGHFPAVDVLESKSRVRDSVVDAQHRTAANTLLRAEAAYRDKEDMIMVGAYQKGSDLMVDAAVENREKILAFLQQQPDEFTPAAQSREILCGLAAQIEQTVQRKV